MKTSRVASFVAVGLAWCWCLAVARAQTVTATLTSPSSTYLASGGSVTLTANITYSVAPSALGGSIFLPTGWSFAGVGGPNVPQLVPSVGDTGQLGFAYLSFPSGSAQFTVTLDYVGGLAGNQTISSSFQYRSPTRDVTPAAIILTGALTAVTAISNKSLVVGTAATSFTPVTVSGGRAPYSYAISPALPASLSLNPSTGAISGTPAAAFNATTYTILITDAGGATAGNGFTLSAATGLVITQQPRHASTAIGGSVVLNVVASGADAPTYQWRRNGAIIAGATASSLTLANFQVADVGSYSVEVRNSSGTLRSDAAVVALSSTAKAAGAAYEFAANILHGVTGFTYDQVLLTGSAATITADPGQITRISYIDLNDDIVQVEFSGAGALTLSLENASGPAAPVKYNQPGVQYMKGHASVFITGVDETTHFSVFSVGTANAVNQGLFPAGMTYDGVADIGLLSITSTNGKLGSIRTANASYLRAAGQTGIYAPAVAVQGPTFVGDITADADATAVLVFGSTTDVRLTGGDLLQLNNRAVQVDGIAQIAFTAGTKSNGNTLPAQPNRARLERNGVDVTSELVR